MLHHKNIISPRNISRVMEHGEIDGEMEIKKMEKGRIHDPSRNSRLEIVKKGRQRGRGRRLPKDRPYTQSYIEKHQ